MGYSEFCVNSEKRRPPHSLVTSQASLTKQSGDIDKQVANMERVLSQRQKSLTDSFIEMESAQLRISQQLTYLSKISSSG